MNIVFLLRPWPIYGGGETVTRILANEFVKRGHRVSVLFTKQTEYDESLNINQGIQEIKVPGVTFDEHVVSVAQEETDFANRFLADYCKQKGVDVIINQWWPKETLTGLKNSCIVLNCLHTEPFKKFEYENKRWRGRDALLKLLGATLYFKLRTYKMCKEILGYLPYVHKYLFLSRKSVLDFSTYLGTTKYVDQVDYCNNPLTYTHSFTEERIARKENYVLFVGRMYENHKKVSKVLDAWKKVEQVAKEGNWKLLLVGDGPDLEWYKQKAQSMQLVNYEFLGYQAPQCFFELSKIFLMTSTHEGWPMTLAEAKQFAVVPIVRNTFAALDEMVHDGVDGRVINGNDSKAFIEALQQLMQDNELRVKMAKACLDDIDRFSVNVIADKWESLFDELKLKVN